MNFRKKPVVIDAITFDEFVQYGKDSGANLVNGMPWSFSYKGHPVTHENDTRYLIPTLEGTHNFTPDDMLITGVKGEIYPCKRDIFEVTYEAVASPAKSDSAIEREIQAKGKTAPRVTPDDLQANIASEHYFTAEDGVLSSSPDSEFPYPASLTLLTFCVLVLRNGFTVTGESACASPENFDEEIARKIARQNAEQKIWPLMGYALKEQMSKVA